MSDLMPHITRFDVGFSLVMLFITSPAWLLPILAYWMGKDMMKEDARVAALLEPSKEKTMADKDTVKVVSEVTYNAWKAPRFASMTQPPGSRQDGVKEMPSIPVGDLEPHVLDALAQTWLNHLYASVGRKPPVIREQGNG